MSFDPKTTAPLPLEARAGDVSRLLQMWGKRTAVGAGDGGTFICEPVYRHEALRLLEIVAGLEARIIALEAAKSE